MPRTGSSKSHCDSLEGGCSRSASPALALGRGRPCAGTRCDKCLFDYTYGTTH